MIKNKKNCIWFISSIVMDNFLHHWNVVLNISLFLLLLLLHPLHPIIQFPAIIFDLLNALYSLRLTSFFSSSSSIFCLLSFVFSFSLFYNWSKRKKKFFFFIIVCAYSKLSHFLFFIFFVSISRSSNFLRSMLFFRVFFGKAICSFFSLSLYFRLPIIIFFRFLLFIIS